MPSYLKRRRLEKTEESTKKPYKTTTWDRDIVRLPNCCSKGQYICFPRGKYRATLGQAGLIGKVRLTSDMTVSDVEDEVRSTFKLQMGGRADFPFQFLQPTGSGSSSLMIPNVSSSFEWTPSQVAKLGSSKGNIYNIYILAKDKLIYDDEVT